MEKVLVRQLFRQTPADGAQLLVSGWVRTVRDSKAFAFIELNDGSFFKKRHRGGRHAQADPRSQATL